MSQSVHYINPTSRKNGQFKPVCDNNGMDFRADLWSLTESDCDFGPDVPIFTHSRQTIRFFGLKKRHLYKVDAEILNFRSSTDFNFRSLKYMSLGLKKRYLY